MLLPALLAAPASALRAQRPPTPAGTTAHRMVQLVDTAGTQQELARDYATGVRLAWARRAAGGVPVPQLVTLPVDTRNPAAVQQAIDQLRGDASVIGTVGIVGDQLALDVVDQGQLVGLRMAHIGPWMADARHDRLDNVVPLFPSRAMQIRHAVTTVRGMGIDRMAIVYPDMAQRALYAREVDAVAQALGLRPVTLAPQAGEPLAKVAEQIGRLDAGLVLFVGAAPELSVLTQAMAARRIHRFVMSLSDVDQGTLQQMPLGAGVPLILTQVVPNPATSTLPIVADYRATLKRLYDESPSPISLAGMLAGLYALDAYRRTGKSASRESLLSEVQRRPPTELGGFRFDFVSGRRGSGYVTHTLLRADGSLIG